VLRIGASLLLIFPLLLLCPLTARGQASRSATNTGRRVEIEVTVRADSGELISSSAVVKLYLNGMPCDEGTTTNGRITFSIAELGRFSAVADAPGYKSGRMDASVSEPVKVDMEVTLEADSSLKSTAGAPGSNVILAPRAQEALDRGIQALREDKLDDANKALGRAAKLAPNNPRVLYQQGLLNLRRHDWAKAQSTLEKATQMDPTSARAWAGLGMALCNQKKYAESVAPLEKSLVLDAATGWQTQYSLGEAYYRVQRYDDALKASQQAQADAKGQVPQVDLLVARSFAAVGKFADSARILREVVQQNNGTPEALTAQRFLDRLAADGKIPPQ
jgi:Tfp pilus assembly protein PilF